jgi:hypothetical protein
VVTATEGSFSLVGDDGDYGETPCFTPHVGVERGEVTIAHGFSDRCEPPETEQSNG